MVESFSALTDSIDRRVIIASSTAFALGILLRGFWLSAKGAHVVPSPRTTLLPRLAPDQIAALPYPPDSLPGARDVETPYGSIRAYEFGPEDGRKVLLVHGISTPCLALGAVAHGLAEKGCRVCLFDLFGRGYSENPGDLPHDLRLFTTQILLVLASSPLPWTGPNAFSMVGYSLGGGISAGFTSYFPNLVKSLVLLAPSGLIRARHFSKTSRFLYSEGVVPEPLLLRLVKRRLKTPLYPPKKQPANEKVGAADAVQAEAKIESNSQAPLSKTHPGVTIEKAVVHQVDYHDAFVSAFMSSIRYGPIQSQHTLWQRIGKRMSQNNTDNRGKSKVLIVTGDHDPIIDKNELQEDAPAVFDGNVEFSIIGAAHDLPIVKSVDVVETIWKFWN
jgi:pimeloyl-ACP methyl ester carboxylesterase